MPYGTSGIKLVDFLLGIQKKFNLVIYPNKTKPNQFIVETFNEWYNRGEVKDFNQYINLDEIIGVTPANNFAVNQLNFGDTLDTDYISQQFAKGANREYGKQYYTDTTNFFSQGLFEVKTTFATSPLLRIAGTGLSGSVGGINPTPTQFFVGECRYGYQYEPSQTCGSPARVMTYTTSGELTTGLIAYSDRYGTQPILNLRFVTGPNGGIIYEVDPVTGEILSPTGYYCSF
jgi:hypothetical protein